MKTQNKNLQAALVQQNEALSTRLAQLEASARTGSIGESLGWRLEFHAS